MMRWLYRWRLMIWLVMEVADLIVAAIIGLVTMWWVVTHPPSVCQRHAHDLKRNERLEELCSR